MLGRRPLARERRREDAPDGILERAGAAPVHALARRGEREPGAPRVGGVHRPRDEAGRLEPAHHAGQRAAMQMQHGCQLAGQDAGIASDEQQRQALRDGEAELRLHPLRDALELVIDCPDEAHEAQHVVEWDLAMFVHGRCRHGSAHYGLGSAERSAFPVSSRRPA